MATGEIKRKTGNIRTMTASWHLSTCFAVATLLSMMSGLFGLKDVQIHVPKYVRRGTDVRLSCSYDLQNEGLYAIKWYKGPVPYREFYRFLPKEIPSSLAFNMPGVQVNLAVSNDHEILLKNVSLISSGTYKCSVAAEFPFETLEDSGDMRVVVIGEGPPELRLNRSQYYPGDVATAQCQTPPAFPTVPNITWYVNDVKDQGRVWTESHKYPADPLTKFTISTISFNLPEKVAPVRVYCRVSLFTVYDRRSNITTIYPVPRPLTGTDMFASGLSRASINLYVLFLTFYISCLF